MLQVDDTAVSFRHELARRAIEDSLPPVRRQRLHALVLETIVERGHATAQATRILHHATRALDDDAIVRYAPIAAQQASAMGAHRQAAAHYATALVHADRFPPEERARLLEGQSYSSYLTSQLRAAFDARAAALQIWRQLGCREKEGDSLRWLSRITWYDGRRTDADRYAAMALEVLETLPPGRELAMAYSNRAQLHMLAEETAEAVHWGTKASDLARALGDHEILAHALANTGTTEYRFNPETGRPKLEQSLRISIEHGFEDHAGRAYYNLVSHSIVSRDFAGAQRYLDEGLAYCIEHDLDAYTLATQARRAHLNLERGYWDAAADEAEAVLTARPAPQVKITALWVLARIRARRGDAVVYELLDEASSLAHATGELQRIGPVAAARAEAAWLTGDTRKTAEEAKPAFELAMTRQNIWELGELSFWMWRGGQLSEPPLGAARPFALQISGDWRAAAAEWERIGCPYAQAWALADGDEVAQRAALGILDRLGAAGDSIRRRMRAEGVRGIPRGARPATRRNAAGLTPREVEVLALVSQGLPVRHVAERLFVSAKTVDNHLSAIFSKLNVHSRAEAVAAAYDLGIVSRNTES
jgi:DNA-binding CsgD family transcriptional regulator